MAIPSGLAAQAGLTVETTWGVYAVPATFVPLIEESVGAEVERTESAGIIAGKNVMLSQQWTPGMVAVSGDFSTELYDRGIGKLFKLMFGGVATVGSGPYTHTFTPGTLPSATWQFGRPDTTGTVQPATILGCKVGSWEVACKVGEVATLGLTLMGLNELVGSRVVTDGVINSTTLLTSATAAFSQADVGKLMAATGVPVGTTIASVESATNITLSAAATATATSVSVTIGAPLAVASYASGQLPVTFKHGSLSLAGSNAYATEVTLKGDNGLSDARPFLGSVLTREHLPVDLRTYTADITTEFDSIAAYNAFRAGAEAAMVLSFAIGTYSLTFSLNVRYDDAKANAKKGILEKSIPVKAVASSSTDASAITVVLVNGDSTP